MRIDANARLWNVLGLLVVLGMGLAIFADVLSWGMAPLAPDAMPFFSFGHRTLTLDNLLAAGGEATPQHLYWLIFPPLLANKLTYLVDTLVLVLAGVYYLRARRISRLAAWLGGLALGYSGYTFTLFSAGHRGYFHMFSCAVFAFGLLVHCFRERRWFHFAMLGACLAWGVPYQADVLAMVVLLAGAYTLWLTCARASDPVTPPWRRIVRVYPRFLLTLAVAALIAAPGLKSVLDVQMNGRKQQLAASIAATTQGSSQSDRQAQYIFATNWSLPPEDMAEFLVPCLFGVDSADRALPYWGRLGRAYDWAPNRREMPNYRQHTVYLGVVQILFAFLAALAYLAWRRTQRVHPATIGTTGEVGFWVDVPFWVGAGVVCLLLALGRYTPCYHLFYAIPYMDLVRDPVKFHHLVEICTAMLFGVGVEFWLLNRQRAEAPHTGMLDLDVTLRWAAVLAGLVSLGLFLAAAVVSASGESVRATITQVGLGPLAEPLSQALCANIVRSAWLAALAAGLIWLGRSRPSARWPLLFAATALTLIVAADSVLIARRYLRPIDMGPFYRVNPVVRAALEHGEPGAGIANYLTGNDPNSDWFASSLWRNGLRLTIPAAGAATTTETEVAQALGSRPDLFWAASDTRFVAATWSALEPMIQARVVTPVLSFRLDPRSGQVRVVAPAADACLLGEYTAAPPAMRVVAGWRGGLQEQGQLAAMRQAGWDPVRGVVSDFPGGDAATTGSVGQICGSARVVIRRGSDFQFSTTFDVDATQAGMLLTDERDSGELAAVVDGHAAPVQRVNALWCGVPVPAGRHQVRLGQPWHPWPTAASALAGLIVAWWGMARRMRRPMPVSL